MLPECRSSEDFFFCLLLIPLLWHLQEFLAGHVFVHRSFAIEAVSRLAIGTSEDMAVCHDGTTFAGGRRASDEALAIPQVLA